MLIDLFFYWYNEGIVCVWVSLGGCSYCVKAFTEEELISSRELLLCFVFLSIWTISSRSDINIFLCYPLGWVLEVGWKAGISYSETDKQSSWVRKIIDGNKAVNRVQGSSRQHCYHVAVTQYSRGIVCVTDFLARGSAYYKICSDVFTFRLY